MRCPVVRNALPFCLFSAKESLAVPSLCFKVVFVRPVFKPRHACSIICHTSLQESDELYRWRLIFIPVFLSLIIPSLGVSHTLTFSAHRNSCTHTSTLTSTEFYARTERHNRAHTGKWSCLIDRVTERFETLLPSIVRLDLLSLKFNGLRWTELLEQQGWFLGGYSCANTYSLWHKQHSKVLINCWL